MPAPAAPRPPAVTGLTAAAEQVVAARPERVWDLVADISRIGGTGCAPT